MTTGQPDASLLTTQPGGRMPVLDALEQRFATARPLAGRRVAAVLNVTPETTRLARILLAGGARLLVVSSKDTTLDSRSAHTMALLGVDFLSEPASRAEASVAALLRFAPDLVVDNGDIVAAWRGADSAPPVTGGTVHSQHALMRVSALGDDLPFALMVVARSPLKTAIESGHGTAQAAIAGLTGAGVHLSGKRALVVGFGVTGRGVAAYLRGCHCRVAVAEISPVAALQAVYDGYELVPLEEGLPAADVVVTVTDSEQVLSLARIRLLKDGAVVGGIGHSRHEIDWAGLAAGATEERRLQGRVEYVLSGRRLIFLQGLAGNHVFAGINLPEMMDISLGLHALCLERLAGGPAQPPRLLPVPVEVEAEVARLKLEAAGHRWEVQWR